MLNTVAITLLGYTLSGCRSANKDSENTLPVVAPDSKALPGSVNSADAPDAPRVQTNRNEVTTFRDAESGVSFRYPGTWRPIIAGGRVDPPSFTEAVGAARGTQAFVPAGTPLAKTNLLGISFSWTVKPKLNAATCARLATDALPMGTAMPPETISGLQFQRGSGGDNGMCHHASATLDTVVHKGSCYFFERDLETSCPDINATGKEAELTPGQRAGLQHQLDAVMETVTLR